MRSYLHRPDEAFLHDKNLPALARRIELSETAIPKPVANGRLDIYRAAVRTAFDLTRTRWALDEPLDKVVATLERTTKRVRDALGHGIALHPHDVDRWLEIAIIGADIESAEAITRQIEGGIDGLQDRGDATSWYLAGLMTLGADGHRMQLRLPMP